MQHKEACIVNFKPKYAALAPLLLLTGCSDNAGDSGNKPGALTSSLYSQLEVVDKANGVEKMVQESFNKREQMMNEQGQ